MNKLKVLELFGGIGACSKALERLGIDYEIADYVEIDKYAVASFNAMHGTNFEPQDICTWDKDIKVDLIMHGSPCQDFSVAGKGAGGDEGSGTRSSLMYETIRIVKKLKPKYVIWENVKNLLSKKHRHNFDAYLETMEKLGYANYYQVLNAKDYGIPQNRERVFTVSILKNKIIYDDYNSNIRKDQNTIGTLTTNCGISAIRNGWKIIEINSNFEFPPKQELKLKLKDMLEDEVDEKYYLNDKLIKNIKYNKEIKSNGVVRKCGIFDTEKSKHQAGSVYDDNGLSPTLDTMQDGWRQPSIITYNIAQKVKVRKYDVDTKKLVEILRNAKSELDITNKELAEKLNIPITQIEHYFRKDNSFAIPDPNIWFELKQLLNIQTDEFDKSIMTFEEKDGVYDKANRVYDEKGIAPTLTQQEEKIKEDLRIRKLTPKECWRLMGFDDADFEKAEKVNSNTQLYKQAGNSIVVNVLVAIFKELFNV